MVPVWCCKSAYYSAKSIYRGASTLRFIVAALLLLVQSRDTVDAQTIVVRPAPEFSQTDPAAWLNSPPLTMTSLRNRYWSTFYLIDKRGFIRHIFVAETHAGDRRALVIESAIQKLLAESA